VYDQGDKFVEHPNALAWRRPSRRKPQLTEASDSADHLQRKSWLYLTTNALCSFLLLSTALAFFVIVTVAISRGRSNQHALLRTNNETIETSSSSSPRHLSMVEWLDNCNISDRAQLGTAGSPQFQASLWMADVDALQYNVPSSARDGNEVKGLQQQQNDGGEEEGEEEEQFLQRYVLAVLYFALQGPTWTNQLKFLSSEHVCGWYIIERDDSSSDGSMGKEAFASGVICDTDLSVTDIFVPKDHLQEEKIPPELIYLPRLELLSSLPT
jgi:hypothetical protein